MFDDEPAKKPKGHVVGMPIDTLSVDELEELIGQLTTEIERLRGAIEDRRRSKSAADSIFSR